MHPCAVVSKRCVQVKSNGNCSSLAYDNVCANFCAVLCSHESVSLETLPRYFPGSRHIDMSRGRRPPYNGLVITAVATDCTEPVTQKSLQKHLRD